MQAIATTWKVVCAFEPSTWDSPYFNASFDSEKDARAFGEKISKNGMVDSRCIYAALYRVTEVTKGIRRVSLHEDAVETFKDSGKHPKNADLG